MSDVWLSAWAKTDQAAQRGGKPTEWLPLHQHLADTAGVARRLIDDWVSPLVVRRIAADLGGTASDVQTLVTWLAAVHDVGKLSPAFAVQACILADSMRPRGLIAGPELAGDPERSRIRHEHVGHVAVRLFLEQEIGYPFRGAAAQLAFVVGSHHGVPPAPSDLRAVADRVDLSGDATWVSARQAALAWSTELIGGPVALRPYADCAIGRPAQVLLTGIVIMADWIASNAELFPLRPIHTARDAIVEPDREATAERVAAGLMQLDLPPRWTPRPVTDPVATFQQRFGRTGTQPRPVQVAAVEAAQTQDRPGLVIVEAPMGEGKTEAALLAAEVLAFRSGADGCFIALPSRATSDGMFPRVLDWLSRLPGAPADTSVVLAHGTASLNDRYRGLLHRGWLRGVAEDAPRDEVGIAHTWLRGRRKGMLAQFVVGTIDQVLFGALKTRYLMLRHLGLAGKVVVIDEVHAYDVYMSEYLDRVLHWLGAYGTPVVLLSATLPSGRRTQLMAAYDGGRNASPTEAPGVSGYPVVVSTDGPSRSVAASGTPRPVNLDRDPDDPESLMARLRPAVEAGACAVVIRNTVGRVQETAEACLTTFGAERVSIVHSRFLACDRARLDLELLQRFGPPGPGVLRPPGHVVVASQVVEQSLDLDFDLMVTDLAPIDLVLQRMGRLHRHARRRPPGFEQARCILVGVEDWHGEPIRTVRGSRAVYSEHALLRSAWLLRDRDHVELPTEIAPLVEAGYGQDFVVAEGWRSVFEAAYVAEQRRTRDRRDKARDFLLSDVGGPMATLGSWLKAGVGDADDDPRGVGHVRDGGEATEVVVVQTDGQGGLLTPEWVPGGGIPISPHLLLDDRTARIIAACALRLPPAMSQLNAVGNDVITALERNRFISFDQHPLLKDQLILALDRDRRAAIRHRAANFRLTYDLRRGLLHEAA